MGKNARRWECLSHRWRSLRARKQVLDEGTEPQLARMFPCRGREVLACSWMGCWRIIVAAQCWQLMQHYVLFYSLWPCIRNVEKEKINKWRMELIHSSLVLHHLSGHKVYLRSWRNASHPVSGATRLVWWSPEYIGLSPASKPAGRAVSSLYLHLSRCQ